MATKMQMADMRFVDGDGPDTQKVAVLEKPFHMSIRRAEIPIPAEDEVRIRIKWVGICGSDLEAYRGTRAPEFITTPARLGGNLANLSLIRSGAFDRIEQLARSYADAESPPHP